MLKTIQRLFAPPVFEDEDKTRTAFYLNSVSLSAVGVLGLYLIVQNLAGPGFNLNVVDYLLLGFIGLLLVARYAMLKGYVKIASHVVVGFIWLGLAFQAQMADGIRDATFFAFFVIILMASLLLGTRGMLFYSALSILMGFGLVYLENVRGGAIALDSSQNFVRDITFVFVLFAIFLYLVTSNLSNALNRARLTAQELQKNNEQLLALQTELEARVAARTRDLEIVTEVGAVAATILESKRLLQEMVKLTQERFNLYHAQIYLLDDAGESLVLAAGVGEAGRAMVAAGQVVPINHPYSLVARVARERKGLVVNDVAQTPGFSPNPLLPDTRAELAAPMLVGDTLVGVLEVQSETMGRFTEADVNVQTTLASQVATSIQNVRLFEQARLQAQLEATVNAISQKIQSATTVEDTLQTTIREIGAALGASRVSVYLSAQRQNGEPTARLY